MEDSDPLVTKLFLKCQELKYTEEEVAANLYIGSEQRLNILKNLMSQFSEQYRNDLLEAENVKWEIARQIHALEFCDAKNKITFVMADCSIEEQRKIFGKIITALEMVQLAEMSETCDLVKDNVIFPNAPLMPGFNEEQGIETNKSRNFNLDDLRVHLKEATETIEKYKHLLEEPVKKELFEPQNKDVPLLTDTEVEGACNAINTIADSLKNLPCQEIPEYQLEPSKDISKFNEFLIASNEQVIQNSEGVGLEVSTFDLSIYLEKILKFRSDSKLLNLKK